MPLIRLLVPSSILLLSLLLPGCASTGSQATSSPSAATTLADHPVGPYRDVVTLSGRMTANYQKDGNPESATVKFNWLQSPERTDIELADPFGNTVATIAITQQQASLTRPGKETLTAPTMEALGEQTLGFALPVSGLRQWLQGYASKQDGSAFVASPRMNKVETQDGWRLRYVSWQDESAAVPVPRRIDAERVSAASLGAANVESLAIRVVIDSWE